MMTAIDVLAVMDRLAEAGVPAWLDGGWGVDALIGEQTREHLDLDIVIALDHSAAAQAALHELGYEVSEDERPTRLALVAAGGRQVDLHTVVFDREGGGVQRLQDGRSYRYPPKGFRGRGEICGRALACPTPEVQLECHLGYEPTETDLHDVVLLAERFKLPVPPMYRRR